ncbi:hypothetical protein SAMD00019534_016840, partial [Acytostelium subglobosum LB1]|uniref:hypothetical protein n=1 Tax=Acytostelium subglobosum LB1 TaxID=1410327 RepID=UPI000644E51F
SLPITLNSLAIDYQMVQSLLPGQLPDSITSLFFTYGPNAPITSPDILPKSLTSLILGNSFNQVLHPGTLPQSLLTLELGDEYNQPLGHGTLPNSLYSLIIRYSFSQTIECGVLPESLKLLKLLSFVLKPILPGSLPQSLTHLEIDHLTSSIEPGVIPRQSLKQLILRIYQTDQNWPDILPPTLTSLSLDTYTKNVLLNGTSTLPSLTELTFPFYGDLTSVPSDLHGRLKVLKFGTHFDQVLTKGDLPITLTKLDLGMHFNRPLDEGILHEGIIKLCIGKGFQQSLDSVQLPSTIQTLSTFTFNQSRYVECIACQPMSSTLMMTSVKVRIRDYIIPEMVSRHPEQMDMVTSVRLKELNVRFLLENDVKTFIKMIMDKAPHVDTFNLYNKTYDTRFTLRRMDNNQQSSTSLLIISRHNATLHNPHDPPKLF